MEQVLLVEGRTDKTFWEQLLQLYSTSCEIQSPSNGGKESVGRLLGSHIALETAKISVALDIDKGTPQDIENRVRGWVGPSAAGNSVVAPIPLGLHGDQQLADLGISSHAMEDYLLKVLLEAPAPPDVKGLCRELRSLLESHGVSLDSSKAWFQLLRPILGLSHYDIGAVQQVFEHHPERLKELGSPLINALRKLEG